MMPLTLWFLAAFGVAFVLGHSKISLPARILLGGKGSYETTTFPLPNDGMIRIVVPAVPPLVPFVGPFLVALVECAGCLGFHCGLLAGWLWPALGAPFGLETWVFMLVLGFATSATNLVLGRYVGMV